MQTAVATRDYTVARHKDIRRKQCLRKLVIETKSSGLATYLPNQLRTRVALATPGIAFRATCLHTRA